MPSAEPDQVTQVRRLLEQRIRELQEELGRLRLALDDLTFVRTGQARKKRERPRAQQPPRKPPKPRAAHAVKLIRTHPGITAGELAERMGISRAHVYRVVKDLVRAKKIRRKSGRYTAA